MGYDRRYFLKKAFALYPGVRRPISAAVLAPHYRARRAARGPVRGLVDVLVGLGFLAWIPLRARAVQRKFGLSDAWRRDAIAIGRARFADPNDIALFRITHADEFDRYIRRFEDAALNKLINPAGWRQGCALADKRLFRDRCRAAGLPHPATIALVEAGAIHIEADPAGRDLIVKPIDGEGGDGVVLLERVIDRDDLRARLVDRPPRPALIVQERIAPHPALADLALDALPTVRVVTIRDAEGVPQVASATLRFASVAHVRVDNMKAGGLIAAVDLAHGTLGIACHGYGGGDHSAHPVTGARITGRVLPDWDATCALAAHAHATAFAEYGLVGWDIATTPDGPVLIEGNAKPGVLMPQRAAREGLAQGLYGALLAQQLQSKRH